MCRIALYSDIHGNRWALEAVYADIADSGITERYCLGDLVGYGPDPVGVIDLVRATGDPVVQGNYDRGIGGKLGDCGCYYATKEAAEDGRASYDFTVDAVGEADRAWLAGLATEVRFGHAGRRVLLCHGSPRRVNEYLMPDRPEALLVRLAAEAEADVVCCGHVHVGYLRSLAGSNGRVDYVNAGSVGKPRDGDPRAGWVELTLGDDGSISCVFHRVSYDVSAVAAATVDAGLPQSLADAIRHA